MRGTVAHSGSFEREYGGYALVQSAESPKPCAPKFGTHFTE